MPHPKAFSDASTTASSESSRVGAVVIAAFSTSILAAAMWLARPGATADPLAETVLRSLGKSLGITSTIDVVADSRAVLVLPAGARTFVAGRVLDADGSPVAASAVRVRSDARPDRDWVTSSGADGSFRVEGVAEGKLRVVAQDVEAGIVESPVLEPNEAHAVVLVLDRTVDVSGVALDERNAPIPRAAVKCIGRSGAPDRVIVADEEGRFALRGAARNIGPITVWGRGYEGTTFTVDASASGVIQRAVRLHPARPLRGLVVDPAGNVIAGARVAACSDKETEVATSDAAGAFELPATVMGCSVTASHPRFAVARPMRIADRADLTLRLGAGGAIEGTVVGERGKPVALFSVTIASFEAEDAVPGVATRTGEVGEHLRGSFRLDDLAPGTYVLQISAEGMVDAQSRPIEVGRGKVVRGEQIALSEIVAEPAAGEEPVPVETAGGSEKTMDGQTPESSPEETMREMPGTR